MKQYWLSALAVLSLFSVAQGQPATQPSLPWAQGLKVLIVGGGWAHDFETWCNKADTASLQKAGITNTHYLGSPDSAAKELPNADVLVLCANTPGGDTPAFTEAFSNFVAAGKGVVIVHASVWYNWHWGKTNSDAFNRKFVGGGARDHDGVSEFDETVVKDHPVTAGLPPTFKISDELYHTATISDAVPMEVLTEASRPGGQKYASVWLPKNDKTRIVCIALGHDGGSHNSPYYQRLLVNAINWVGKQ